jgi:hypothetical protein
MIYVLIMTIQSSHVDGGLAMHSIEFSDFNGAYNAGEKWRESLRNHSVGASYVVVEKP